MKGLSISMTLAVTLLVSTASESRPVLIPYEQSVEGGKVLDIDLELTAKKEPTGNGVATIGRPCRGCAPLRLRITPESQVILPDRLKRPIPVTAGSELVGKIGDVFYIIEDKRLTRIQLY